jgi:hypothetical protein
MATPVKMSGPVRLDELIEAVRATHETPLDQLSGAVLTSEALGDLADSLIGHFVDQARRSGASWAEIGRSMGVTKQAAQKRFVDRSPGGRGEGASGADGFARFTVRARNAVVLAQNEARTGSRPEISPAHLLLGLVVDPRAVAARALADQGVDADAVRRALAALPPADGEVPALIPFDAASRRVLQGAFAEDDRIADRIGDDRIGTGHVLLALLTEAAEHGGLPAGITVDRERVEAAVVRIITEDGQAGEDDPENAGG